VGAQSIARGHIGGNISQENKIFEILFFTEDKKGSIQQQTLEQKIDFHLSKVKNNHVPKSCFYFFRNFDISPTIYKVLLTNTRYTLCRHYI
jgi:hypothetical protein